jgi:putative membrane protein
MATTTIAALLADTDGWHGHMDWGGGWWMLVWGTLMMVGLVLLAVWIVRTVAGGAPPGGSAEDSTTSARRILGERYARGEISTEEYRERRDELSGD